MTIESDIQRLAVDNIVEMFSLDATGLTSSIDGSAGAIHRFCSSVKNEAAVVWQGYTYQPYPIEAKGFDRTSQGQIPRPTITLADVSGVIGAVINEFDDLLGATVTRLRTLKKYLDGEAEADPTAEFPQEVYRVEHKPKTTRRMVEFTLASPFDLHGLKLPGRTVLKQTCTHIYRRWNGVSFDYSQATCPYTGTDYFDRLGVAATNATDDCGKRLSDCVLRYPQPATLPTWAFPGVYNVRQ